MDFRTEWSSWVLVVLMVVISYFLYPVGAEDSVLTILWNLLGIPLFAIAIACIPVLIVCYFIKVIPDIDYSIRLAFVYFLFECVRNFM